MDAYSVLTQLNWETISGNNSIKQSNLSHGGGWLAFVLKTKGYYTTRPVPTYNYGAVNYFGTANIVENGVVTGFLDEYYGGLNPQGFFRAYATSINAGGTWYAELKVN